MYHIVHLEHLRLNITLLLPHYHHIDTHNYNFKYDHFVGLRNMHIENERIDAGLVYFFAIAINRRHQNHSAVDEVAQWLNKRG